MKKSLLGIICVVFIFYLTGCGTTKVYKVVFKEEELSYHQKDFSVTKSVLKNAMVKILMARNFTINEEDDEKGFILAKRPFRKGKRNIILAVQAKMISFHDDGTTLLINAIQTTERVFIEDHTRFFLFLVPMPGGGGKSASRVKEGELIIEDPVFYKKFFDEVGKTLAKWEQLESNVKEWGRLSHSYHRHPRASQAIAKEVLEASKKDVEAMILG